MTNKQLIKKLEQACVVCRDCGLKYGVYSVGCSSVWEGVCNVCGETKGVTETRDYGYLITGIRKLKLEDGAKSQPFSELTKDFSPERKAKIKNQSKEVAKHMLAQEPIMTDEDLDKVMNPSYKHGPMTNHPITPPPELVSEWANMFEFHSDAEVFSKAARWGADAELEACCRWVSQFNYDDYSYQEMLQTARRPKPPSLKEQALAVIENSLVCDHLSPQDEAIIRKALEALPND